MGWENEDVPEEKPQEQNASLATPKEMQAARFLGGASAWKLARIENRMKPLRLVLAGFGTQFSRPTGSAFPFPDSATPGMPVW